MTRTKGLFAGVLLLILLLSNLSCGTQPKVGPHVGMQAPEIQGTTLKGDKLSLKQLRGQPTVIIFWQTISLPAKRVMDNFQKMQAAKDQKFQILAINLGEASSEVSEFMAAEGIEFPVLIDQQQTWANLYRVDIMPTVFLVDKTGLIQLVDKGGLDWDRLEQATKDLF